ncbi:MAG: DUF6629 family protein [Cyanobacteriota bacterium]|nr:DUF6629 family protein [Cyanobacteriota bacterium]
MCFSATASFVASGVLLPLGAASLAIAMAKGDRLTVPLAMAPMLFSFQQALEGMVWLGLAEGSGDDSLTVGAAVAYLFFAFAFWPVWIPWAALRLWPREDRSPLLLPLISALSLVPGTVLWLPLLRHPLSALPEQIGHSLVYPLTPWSAALLPQGVGHMLYAIWIVLPLFLVPSHRTRTFALSLLLAFGLTQWARSQALASVWCFACALLSVQILWILKEPTFPDPRLLEDQGQAPI